MNPVEVVLSEANIVPWMDTEEFKKTYHDLYSDNVRQQRRGVERVFIWRIRCGSLPNAVDATAGIVTALMHHTIFNNTESSETERDIQMLYDVAVTRFVYLMLEKDKPATSTISLSAQAIEHNIPTWFIDLHNDAARSRMPSLSQFRFGADFALKYLKETYWAEAITTQRQLSFSIDGPTEDILNLIQEYKNLQFQEIIVYLTEEEKGLLSQHLNAVLEKMFFYIDRYKQIFLEILVEPGNFTSFDDLDLLLDSKGMKFLDEPNLIIPYKIQELWFPLLRELHNRDLLSEFLEQLLLAQGKTINKTCHKLTIAWGIEIFEEYSKSILTPLFRKKKVLHDKISVAYCCALRPNPYSKELLSRIIAKAPEKQKKVFKKFCNVVDMFLQLHMDQKDVERESASILHELIFTMKDVKKKSVKKKCKKSVKKKCKKSVKKKCKKNVKKSVKKCKI